MDRDPQYWSKAKVCGSVVAVAILASCSLAPARARAATATPRLPTSRPDSAVAAPTPTATCSCSAACRCTSDEQTVYLRRRKTSLDARLRANTPFGVLAASHTRLRAAAVESWETGGGACPQVWPSPAATATPGGAWNLQAIQARQAWSALGWPAEALESRTVYVAIVDTGLDISHPDLQGRIAPWRRSFVGPVPDEHVSDDADHGTAMAGIIAARGNNGAVGIDGIMWGAQIIPCKAGGQSYGSRTQAIQCLEWLADLIDRERVRIVAVNFSFGSECCDCAMEAAVARLRDRGVLLIASAGNGRINSDARGTCPFYPASYPVSNVISVTGSDRYGNVLYRYGKRTVHLAAPGVSIPVLVPGGGRSVIPGGSSPAAAHVTGVAALLAAQDPARTWMETRNLLLASGAPVACGGEPACALVTGRILRAWGANGVGALSCSQQVVVRRLLPVEDTLVRRAGETLALRVLSIECATARPLAPAIVRRVASSATVQVALRDDGIAPDPVAGDGEFNGVWVVPAAPNRDYDITVAGETLRVHVGP
ncbi:MAG: hypothetical protein KatS3mg077_1156 [Candidatus Binatia bacterium]|nr:MAG: hypothetical protein KatS3mg077_1156 [Candidatus Binatia bacterium]